MPTKKPLKKHTETLVEAVSGRLGRTCKHCQRKIVDQSKAQLCWECSRRIYELYSELQAEYRSHAKLWREEEVNLHLRAEAAEKHNAILLADAEKLSHCSICGADRCEFPLEYVCDTVPCLDGYKAKLAPPEPGLFHVEQKAKPADDEETCPWPNTCPMCLWQRLKAWVWG